MSEAEDLIPDEPLKPSHDIGRAKLLVYGVPKVGKTELLSEFPRVGIIATEEGTTFIERTLIPGNRTVQSWRDFGLAIAALKTDKAKGRFDTIGIDTIDNLWLLCESYVVDIWNATATPDKQIETAQDLGFGVGLSRVAVEFKRAMMAVASLPYGLVMVSHADRKDFEDPDLGKFTRVVPSVHERCRRIIAPMADMIILYDRETVTIETAAGPERVQRRVMRCRQSRHFDSGDRTACLPDSIPIPNTPRGAYEILSQAFNEGLEAKLRGEVINAGPDGIVPRFEKPARIKASK